MMPLLDSTFYTIVNLGDYGRFPTKETISEYMTSLGGVIIEEYDEDGMFICDASWNRKFYIMHSDTELPLVELGWNTQQEVDDNDIGFYADRVVYTSTMDDTLTVRQIVNLL